MLPLRLLLWPLAAMAMAVALPILISVFGFEPEALLPVMGFLIGIMKGATIGGAVPAILFNTPGTPDAFMTTLDGFPMARRGEARRETDTVGSQSRPRGGRGNQSASRTRSKTGRPALSSAQECSAPAETVR